MNTELKTGESPSGLIPKNVPTTFNRFETKYNDGTVLVSQYVSFVPDVTIECDPPYIKGKADNKWVKYPKGKKPKNKKEWVLLVGMPVICFY